MKQINVIFVGLLLASNAFANPGSDFVTKNEYLAKFETLDLDKSDYADKEVSFEVYTDDRPKIGEGVKVFSGDTMVLQRIGKVVPCIVPMETWRRTIKRMIVGELNFVIKKGRKLCRHFSHSGTYHSDYSMLPSAGADPSGQTQTAVVWEKKGKFNFAVGGKANWIKKGAVEGKDFKYTKAFKSANLAFQRSIEYSGRSDALLTFVYSEFNDGLARDAFTREFTIDLNEGNIGGFKGAIFEVLEATNFEVAYRVIRHFPPAKD